MYVQRYILGRSDGFDWDAGNRDKCRKHGVSPGTIEALFRSPIAVHPARNAGKEERFIAIGSADGRNVLVVFTLRTQSGKTLIPSGQRAIHASAGGRSL
jgi:uncharacterized DUF497 family protein